MSDHSDRVIALLKKLVILNKAENVLTANPPSVEEVEQWQSKRTKVRQELVLALSVRAL